MSEIVLTRVPWPVGTTVRAYPRRSELKLPDMAPPGIAPVAQADVAHVEGPEYRSLTFDLPPGNYWAIAPNPDAPAYGRNPADFRRASQRELRRLYPGP